jgi:hypothetical protein
MEKRAKILGSMSDNAWSLLHIALTRPGSRKNEKRGNWGSMGRAARFPAKKGLTQYSAIIVFFHSIVVKNLLIRSPRERVSRPKMPTPLDELSTGIIYPSFT